MSLYYSRVTNIELIVQSLRRLRELCEGSNHLELSDAFVIRIKIMQHLAKLAFNYSLTVSYLCEQKEYAPMADLLDDVYLQLPRKNLQHVSNDYRKIVSVEYDALLSSIDMMDERLKTIRVVCFTRRNCQKPRRQRRQRKHAKRSNTAPADHVKPTQDEDEDQCSYLMNTRARIYDDYDSDDYVNHDDDILPPTVTRLPIKKSKREYYQRRPVLEEYDAETSRNMSIRKYESKMNSAKTLSDINTGSYYLPITKTSDIHAESCSVPMSNLHFKPVYSNEFEEFKTKVQSYINMMGQYYTWSSKLYIVDITVRLFAQCKTGQELFEYILLYANFIAQHPILRASSNTAANGRKRSFMQVLILKCVQLSKEINDRYDEIRKTQRRANPGLRSAKSSCLSAIKNAQIALCENYNKYPFEHETLQELLASKSK